MAFLNFNKPELVNLSYSLKREILSANKTGAYCNTSIVTCNTRRYHGLLAVPIDNFGEEKYMMLSSMDESLILNGKQFNLGIHCYGDVYQPRGHKYIIDFDADPAPRIVYKVGEIIFAKEILMAEDKDQVMIKYEVLQAPSTVDLRLTPFLAFRNIHSLTRKNDQADLSYREVKNGVSFKMYDGFPDLDLQFNTKKVDFIYHPDWYMGITYSDEFRRGFDCKEDLYVPGYFETQMSKGDTLIFSASVEEVNPSQNKRKFNSQIRNTKKIYNVHDQLAHCANLLICDRNNHKRIDAGFSWLYTGLLRETLISLAGLTLYAKGDVKEYEEILDNLIADEQVRLFKKTTQTEAPLIMAKSLQDYMEFSGKEKHIWKKYGETMKGIVESYLPGIREEVSMQPNGLLWAQKDGVALSWMNAYVNGVPVTERAGYQVELNAFWYNAVCFVIEMEKKYNLKNSAFIEKFAFIRDLIEQNFTKMFWDDNKARLADYVNEEGRNMDVRPNQFFAVALPYSPISDEIKGMILRVVESELITRRGIRTLSPRSPQYRGVYEGTQIDRDLAYHQGSTRPSILGYYVDFCFKAYGSAFYKKAEWLVEGFYTRDLSKHGVGSFAEIYDGDPPHEPHGAISAALSTAALLRIEYLMEKNKEESL